MKTSSQISVNPLARLFAFALAFLVLCPGQKAIALDVSSQAKAQLHTPWKLLSERLRAIINRRAADGSVVATPIENRLISVPYDGTNLDWTLTGGTVAAAINVSTADMNATSAAVTASQAHVHIVLNQLSLDQVVERNIGGVVVRVHLNAVCGPIEMDQANASAQANFAVTWPNGSPAAALSSLDLGWGAGTWTFSDFTCTGPSGLDQLVREGLADFLKEPSVLKPFVESYVTANLQSSIDASLNRLRSPFALNAKNPISLSVGALMPAPTGVVADLTLRTSSKTTPRDPLPLPSASVLKALSTSQPVLVGDVSVIEYILANRLGAEEKWYRMDLQKVEAFHKLMKSRLKQLFVWHDLWNYSSNAPFYLNIANPGSLKLKHAGTSMTLSSAIPLQTVIQSYRSDRWWNYVESNGTAQTAVTLSLADGALSYSTTIDSLSLTSKYGAEYRAKYHKKKGDLNDKIVEKAIAGPQPALSGSYKLPAIDLEEAGSYRASSLKWLNSSTFTVNFVSRD